MGKEMKEASEEATALLLNGQEVSVTSTIHFDIFTLFPAMFDGPFAESIIKRAREKGILSVNMHDIRSYTTDRHHVCDDTPYGGGGGMIMKPQPICRAVETVLARPQGWQLAPDEPLPDWDESNPRLAWNQPPDAPIILLTPQGRPLTQSVVQELSGYPRLALICGRYEGVDERVRTQLVTDEISIGDYVLSGGELAAMVLVDSITRLIPGVLGYEWSAHKDSHSPGMLGLLEGAQYTRPQTFRNESIPAALMSGHHAQMEQWHHEQSLLRTLKRRPDLLVNSELSEKDKVFLRQHGWEKP